QHDDRGGTEGSVVLDQCAGLLTIQTRHHDVDKDDVGVIISDLGQGIKAVYSGDDVTTDLLQQRFRGTPDGLAVRHNHVSQAPEIFVHKHQPLLYAAVSYRAARLTRPTNSISPYFWHRFPGQSIKASCR